MHAERASGSAGISRLSLQRNFVWSFVGSAGFAASQWAIIVALAKLGSPVMVGVYTFALAVTAPVLLFVQLNLRLVQAVDFTHEYRFSDYLLVRLIGSMVALIAVGGYAWITHQPVIGGVVIMLIALGKTIDGVSDVVYGLLQQRERMDRMAISLLLRGLLQLAAVWIIVATTHSIAWGAAGLVGASITVTLFYDFPSLRWVLGLTRAQASQASRRQHANRRAVLIRLARRAFPLGLMAVLGSLYQNIPRFFIDRYDGVAAVGYFSAVFYLTYAGYTVVAALGNATSPRLAALYATDVVRFRRLTMRLAAAGFGVGALGTIVAVLFGHRVLAILYRADYASQQPLLIWVMISSAVWYGATLLVFAAIAAKRFAPQAYLHGAAAAVTFALCPVLLPRFGLPGAAMALTAGVSALLLGESVVVYLAIRDWHVGDPVSAILAADARSAAAMLQPETVE